MYLVQRPQVLCDAALQERQGAFVAGLTIYAFIVPTGLGLLMYFKRLHMQQPIVQRRLGVMYEKYKRRYRLAEFVNFFWSKNGDSQHVL
jgi:hypothetical protein